MLNSILTHSICLLTICHKSGCMGHIVFCPQCRIARCLDCGTSHDLELKGGFWGVTISNDQGTPAK